jgi:hypothetical protein
MASFVTDDAVSPTIDRAAVPDIDHVITAAVDHDCKTQLSYRFPSHSSCTLHCARAICSVCLIEIRETHGTH